MRKDKRKKTDWKCDSHACEDDRIGPIAKVKRTCKSIVNLFYVSRDGQPAHTDTYVGQTCKQGLAPFSHAKQNKNSFGQQSRPVLKSSKCSETGRAKTNERQNGPSLSKVARVVSSLISYVSARGCLIGSLASFHLPFHPCLLFPSPIRKCI